MYVGRVVDAYTQQPIAGVAIAASDGWAETSEDGSYYLESDGQTFLLQRPGYWPSRVSAADMARGVALLPEIVLAGNRATVHYSLNATDFGTQLAVKDGIMLAWDHRWDAWWTQARLEGGYAPQTGGLGVPYGQGVASLQHLWGRLPNQLEFLVGPALHVQFGDVVSKTSTTPALAASYLRLSPGLEAHFMLRPVADFGFQWRTRLGYYPFALSLGTPSFSGNLQAVDGYTGVEVALGRFVPGLGVSYHLLAGPTSELRSLYRLSLGLSFLL